MVYKPKNQSIINVKSDFISAKKKQEIVLTEQKVMEAVPTFRKYISYWREYPDMFIEMLRGPEEPGCFKFFFYQRVFLRAAMRHKYFLGTFKKGRRV